MELRKAADIQFCQRVRALAFMGNVSGARLVALRGPGVPEKAQLAVALWEAPAAPPQPGRLSTSSLQCLPGEGWMGQGSRPGL